MEDFIRMAGKTNQNDDINAVLIIRIQLTPGQGVKSDLASYLFDQLFPLRNFDTRYSFLYNYAQTAIVLLGQGGIIKNEGGAAFHLDAELGSFGVNFDYATDLGDLNPIPGRASRIYAWGIDANVSFVLPINIFCQCGIPTTFDIGYQRGANSDVFGTVIFEPALFNAIPFPLRAFLPILLGNILPNYRRMATVTADVMKNVSISAHRIIH